MELKVNCTELATWELVGPDSDSGSLCHQHFLVHRVRPAAGMEQCGRGTLPGMFTSFVWIIDQTSNVIQTQDIRQQDEVLICYRLRLYVSDFNVHSALWMLSACSDCSLTALWPRKMKIYCSWILCAERTLTLLELLSGPKIVQIQNNSKADGFHIGIMCEEGFSIRLAQTALL